ncbi:MAG: winged helix DNA-binding protein [Terriglobia bacterium]
MPRKNKVDSTDKITSEILSYFNRNPDAEDTLDGISRWLDTGSRGTLDKALRALVEKGLLKERLRPDGQVVYRRE